MRGCGFLALASLMVLGGCGDDSCVQDAIDARVLCEARCQTEGTACRTDCTDAHGECLDGCAESECRAACDDALDTCQTTCDGTGNACRQDCRDEEQATIDACG